MPSHLIIQKNQNVERDRAYRLFQKGQSYIQNRDYRSAIEVFREVAEIYKRINHVPGEASSLNNLGRAYAETHEYHQATATYKHAVLILERYKDLDEYSTKVLGDTFQNLGSSYYWIGRYDQSLNAYKKSIYFYKKLTKKPSYDNNLMGIALNYSKLGNFVESLTIYQEVLEQNKLSGNLKMQGIILNNIGALYLNQKKYSKALENFDESLRIYTIISEPFYKAYALNGLGVSLTHLSFYSKAKIAFQESIEIARLLKNDQSEGRTLSSLGDLYLKLGQDDDAVTAYQNSLRISQRIGDKDGERSSLTSLGDLFRKRNELELAIVFYKQSVNVTETIRKDIQLLSNTLQESYIQSIAETYRSLADLLIIQGRIGEAQQVLEYLKVQELNDFSKGVRSATPLPEITFNISENQIKAKYSSLIAFGSEYYNCEQKRCPQYEALKTEYQRLSTEFQTFIEQLKQQLREGRLTQVDRSTQDFQNSADRIVTAHSDSILIYPLVLPDKTRLLWAFKGGVLSKNAICPLGENALYKKVAEFQTLLRQLGDETQLKATGKELYDCLVRPIEKELTASQIKHLIFVPDRSTNYLPMGALYDGKQYLIQRFAISNILSAGLTNTDDKLQSVAKTSVLALGLTEAKDKFGALPNVKSELGAIVQQQDGTGIYPGEQYLNEAFTKNILEDKIRGHRILHIATHGEFKPVNPRESYFLLGTGTPYRIPDIQNLRDLKDIHLVVLSACETALGGPDGLGLEVMGMSYFFMGDQNKAKAVMASLWQVNDASTSQLMQQFYKNLATGKLTKPEALRQAQLSLIQGNSTGATGDRSSFNFKITTPNGQTQTIARNFNHPYYWAPFILIGNGL